MVSCNAEVLQTFLDIDAHRGATAPDADDKVGTEAAFKNLHGQPEGIVQQGFLFDEVLLNDMAPDFRGIPHYTTESNQGHTKQGMTAKTYLSAQQLLEDSFQLGADIIASGFKPTIIIAIWRGGTPMGIAVQEMLAYAGIETDHIAIRTSSYSGIDGRSSEIRIHGMNYLIKHVRHEDRLLIVDDVFDTGLTIEAVIDHLREKARLNTPHDIRVAVPYYKPTRNQSGRVPDYFLHETSQWLKYPHSLEGLSVDEVAANRPELYAIIRDQLG